MRGSRLYVAHVGDSTVVMGTKSSEGNTQERYQFKVLTKDHKPSDEDEKKMVESRGGRFVVKTYTFINHQNKLFH